MGINLNLLIMKSRLLKIKGAEVLSRKQLKNVKGGGRGGNDCNQFGYCYYSCSGRPVRCTSGSDCPSLYDCGVNQ